VASTAAIDQALIAKLTSDATLTAAAPGGVFRDMAPQSTTTPFVVVTQMSHVDAYAIGSQAYEELLYLVKVVDQANSSSAAQTAADRVQTLLQGATLTITGYRSMLVQREERIVYVEVDDESDRRWQHRGGLYRVYAEAA
jgi:DNA-binding LytR/AlgR family response regulator